MHTKFTKLVPAALAVGLTATLIAPSVASAGWVRGFSSLEIRSDDISLCADEMTFETEYRSNPNVLPTDYVHALGNPYPYNGGIDTLDLYGTEADALAETNPIATVETALVETFIDPNDVWHEFTGQATIPTPAGFGDGDPIYVTVNFGGGQIESATLTIGDESYGCVVAPTNIDISAQANRQATRIKVKFDPANVDLDSIMISTDNGEAIPPKRIRIKRNGQAVAKVKASDLGVDASTTEIILTGTDLDGNPIEGRTPFTLN